MRSILSPCVISLAVRFGIGLVPAICTDAAVAQLHDPNAGTWTRPIENGPDAGVPWLVNLGPTGVRAIPDESSLVVRHVFPNSPATTLVRVGDRITAVNGRAFTEPHRWARGGANWGYDGPMREFGEAIEFSEGSDGRLRLGIERDGQQLEVTVQIEVLGRFGPRYPYDCEKSAEIRTRALDYLVRSQRNGGWGPVHASSMAGLALLASDDPEHRAAAKRLARAWAANRRVEGLWSWVVGYRLIFLSEFWLATREDFVRPAMEALIHYSETMMHPQFGGFGHTVQPEGYGPMVIPTAIVLLGWELAGRCEIEVSPEVRATALKFIESGTGANGYVCYGTEWHDGGVAGSGDGHLGRTGACVLARMISGEREAQDYIARGAKYLLDRRAAFADGHADNILGVSWALLGCAGAGDEIAFRGLLDYCKAWFDLARCPDGSFVALPGRDTADGGGYYLSSRNHLTAAVALTLGAARPSLHILGARLVIPGVHARELRGKERTAFRNLERGRFGDAWKIVDRIVSRARDEASAEIARRMLDFTEKCVDNALDRLTEVEATKDLHYLRGEFERYQREYGGIPLFDEQAEMWKDLFDQPSWRRELAAGKKYYELFEDASGDSPDELIEALTRFAAANKDSRYAEAARFAAQHVREAKPGDPARAFFAR